jgi:hypothetical protein
MVLPDQLHERVPAGIGELGEVAGQQVAEDQLECTRLGIGVAVVVPGDHHQQPRGDERLEQRSGVL